MSDFWMGFIIGVWVVMMIIFAVVKVTRGNGL
jgi:hypothetical protein